MANCCLPGGYQIVNCRNSRPGMLANCCPLVGGCQMEMNPRQLPVNRAWQDGSPLPNRANVKLEPVNW